MQEFWCNVPFDMHVIRVCNDANMIEIASKISQKLLENLHCRF